MAIKKPYPPFFPEEEAKPIPQGNVREIPLTQGKVAYVSEEDYEKVSQFKWCVSSESRGTKYYAIRWAKIDGKRTKIRMHRFIMGLGTGKEDERVVDHKDHNSLNNTRENLEVITQTENMERSPGWKGSRAFNEAKEDDVPF